MLLSLRAGREIADRITAAALVRLVHHAEALAPAGQSYRTRALRELLAKDRDN